MYISNGGKSITQKPQKWNRRHSTGQNCRYSRDENGSMSLWILKSWGETCSLKHGSLYTTPPLGKKWWSTLVVPAQPLGWQGVSGFQSLKKW